MSSKSVRQTDAPEDRIMIVAEFQKLHPDALFNYFTVPDLLQKRWPPLAEVDQHSGGKYHFSWPKQDWHLRGIYTEFERGERLGFSWKWDHEPPDTTSVTITLEPGRSREAGLS